MFHRSVYHNLIECRGKPIDLYQIHFPGAWSNEEYWDGIADAYDQGLVKAVGENNRTFPFKMVQLLLR